MALKGPRRPNALILQAHDNLRNQAAGRQVQLQQTFPATRARSSGGARPSSSSSKPPQIPSGYPRSPSTGTLLSNSMDLPDLTGSSPGSTRSSWRGGVTASGSSPMGKRSCKQPSRSGSLDASMSDSLRRSTPPGRSPSQTSRSGRVSPRKTAPTAFQQAVEEAAAAADEAADADMADQLAELDELSSLLGIQADDSATSDGRPATGGTTASTSTTAPSGSKGDMASSLGDADEPRCEATSKGSTQEKEEGCGDQDFHSTLQGIPRLQRELQQCKLPHGCRIEASQASPAQFFFTMDVAEGPYTPATITFWIKVFDDFPSPNSFSIRATKRIFHPCIDATTGAVEVCSDTLHSGDGLHLRSLVLAIRELIIAPPDAPAVNGDAAILLQTDRDEFRRVVRLTLNGGEHGGAKFERVLNPSSLGRSAAKDKVSSFDAGRPLSSKVMVDFMQLESMKEKFKLQASEWQQENTSLMEREGLS